MKRPRPTLEIVPEAEPTPPHDHVVQFYDRDATLIQAASAYLSAGLMRGCPAIVISEAKRLPLFRRELSGMAVGVDNAAEMGQLHLLDARATLERFMIDGMPDAQLFRQVVGSLIASTIEIWHPARLHAYGDMVDLLWADGNEEAALALEELWNALARRHGFALFCGYSADHFERDDQRAGFDAVCRLHGHIMPIDRMPSVAS